MKRRAWAAAATLAVLLGVSRTAEAQNTLRNPLDRSYYFVEVEPHLVLGPFNPPGATGGDGFGAGLRATIPIVSNGFIPSLNNSVGIGFGADWVHYSGYGGPRGHCNHFENAPGGVSVCTDVDPGSADANDLILPVVMQWNFWLHRRWSVFAEPGVSFYLSGMEDVGFNPFVLYLGGRFHATKRIAITMRVGYPTFSIGASFLL